MQLRRLLGLGTNLPVKLCQLPLDLDLRCCKLPDDTDDTDFKGETRFSFSASVLLFRCGEEPRSCCCCCCCCSCSCCSTFFFPTSGDAVGDAKPNRCRNIFA